MTGTKFSMEVGNQVGDEDTGDRMATGTDDESTETWSWSWKPSSVGGTINMYMYKNAMSMEDTVFTMNVDDNGNMSGSASASLDSTNPIMEREKLLFSIKKYPDFLNAAYQNRRVVADKTFLSWRSQ